jgi:hypothetical protein
MPTVVMRAGSADVMAAPVRASVTANVVAAVAVGVVTPAVIDASLRRTGDRHECGDPDQNPEHNASRA